MKTRTIPALLLIFSASYLQAQTTSPITLQEAFDLAIANSKELKLSQAALEQAKASVALAKDRVWPEVKVSVTYLHVNKPTVSFANAPDESVGGSEEGNPLDALGNIHDIGLAQVNVSEPVFAGFKIRNTKLMQQYLAEAAAYDETTTKSKVVTNTARALYQYFELLETRKVIDENLKQAKQQVEEFKNQEAQGLLARNDRLKAELQVDNIELTRTEINNSVLLAEFNLKILLGIPESNSLRLDTTGMFRPASLQDIEASAQMALDNRPEIKSAHSKVKASEAETRIAKASRYPSLALSGGYVNAYIPDVLTVSNALNGGVSLQYNLTGGLQSKHQLRQAKARQQQAEISEQMVIDKVRSDLEEKWLNYKKAREKIDVVQQAIEQATENFRISKNKFDAGLMLMSDYLDADVILLQAQINYASARAERMIAFYELEEARGNIQ